MEKIQLHPRKDELAALRKVAGRTGQSVEDLVREAIRKLVWRPTAEGSVALRDGKPRRPAIDHDSVHDEP
jgi:hypothetical protein